MSEIEDSSKQKVNVPALPPRVLSIQSTVVSGYVGNKSVMFPLQLLGFDVSPLNTVQFSNHTGKGSKTTGKEMSELVLGLKENDIFDYPHVITGYMGSIECLSGLATLIKELDKKCKEKSGKLFYACDPVMGDNGKLYSQSFQSFVDVYKKDIIPLATLITPNQTEASFLLDNMKIDTIEDGCLACRKFHDLGVRYVVITSLQLPLQEQFIDIIFSDSVVMKCYVHICIYIIYVYIYIYFFL
ncbi:hypothetical protein RFI_38823 [Reticulomyxa filosa]|uniref:pyridoxal kinase n=1 Tax=Reticulomyxa filosa TaxID=46433 RepID=X6LAV3_RETFI|nr:hypothetical protein RFI_38823 [Reticulomyxa filosa]|eukprot:ETN98668.1 hypothetical protein RFI_38823 [Reticulomyxa filosa]